jgi:hypothetical protein
MNPLARRLDRLEGQASYGPPIVIDEAYPDEPTADLYRRNFGEEGPPPGRLVIIIKRFSMPDGTHV